VKVLDLIRESSSFSWKKVASKLARELPGARISVLPPSASEAYTATLEVAEQNFVWWERDLGALLINYSGLDFVILPLRFMWGGDKIRLSLPILVRDGKPFPGLAGNTLLRLARETAERAGVDTSSWGTKLATASKFLKLAPTLTLDDSLKEYAWFIKEVAKLVNSPVGEIEDISDKDVRVELKSSYVDVVATLVRNQGQSFVSRFKIAGGLLQDRVIVDLEHATYEKHVQAIALQPNELESFVHDISLQLDAAKKWKKRMVGRIFKKAFKKAGVEIEESTNLVNVKVFTCSLPGKDFKLEVWTEKDDKWLVALVKPSYDSSFSGRFLDVARGKANLTLKEVDKKRVVAIVSEDYIDFELLFKDMKRATKTAYEGFTAELARLVRGILEEV